jgi:class 3 adenylate cyclase/HAMP domain-containing protein
MPESCPPPTIGKELAPPSVQADQTRMAPRLHRFVWIVPLVGLINLGGLGLLSAYSMLNLLPDLPEIGLIKERLYFGLAALLAVALPAGASWWQLRPIRQWLGRLAPGEPGTVAPDVAEHAANIPFRLAACSMLGWGLLVVLALTRGLGIDGPGSATTLVHLVVRPLLGGLIVSTAVLLACEAVCRSSVWPALLSGIRITGNSRVRRLRISHRLLALWVAISVIPLGAVALTTYARITGTDLAVDTPLGRIVSVVLFIAVAAMAGGGVLSWAVSRSIAHPLKALEDATHALSAGRFDTRVVVNATDEFGTLAEGFNLAAQRLSRSYADLETRNQELALALDRVTFLEHVKFALDRFVPETVRHAIEQNPDAPRLAKEARDVTVLFLDIEGYSRLSEELPRNLLNALVERYFSLFLESIRAQGGDINETAGDGLMIIFQSGSPADHAAAALQAAQAIQAQTAEANRHASPAQPPIRINIGISSGECDVGTTRFQGLAGERWTFTATGPVTNLAARLSDHAHGGQILVSPETQRRLSGRFTFRSIGELQLRNLSAPVRAWEVLPPVV